MNDRKMVVLDEASGLIKGSGKYRDNLFSELSSLRDSGIAQITKAASASRLARTRKLWISNPASSMSVGGLGSGLRALNELIDLPEDIARFDFAFVMMDEPLTLSLPQVQAKATAKASNALLSWVWSRRPDQILWEKGAEQYAMKCGVELAEKFAGSETPLLQSSNSHIKIARIATAIAARTFHSDESGEILLVGKEHVKAAVDWLYLVYIDDKFGYFQEAVRGVRRAEKFENQMDIVEDILRKDTSLLMMLYEKSTFKEKDIRDSSINSGWYHGASGSLLVLPMLIDTGAVVPSSRDDSFKLTADMRKIVRQLVEEM